MWCQYVYKCIIVFTFWFFFSSPIDSLTISFFTRGAASVIDHWSRNHGFFFFFVLGTSFAELYVYIYIIIIQIINARYSTTLAFFDDDVIKYFRNKKKKNTDEYNCLIIVLNYIIRRQRSAVGAKWNRNVVRPAAVCAHTISYVLYISARPSTGGPFSMRLIDLNVSIAETIHNKNNTFRTV